MGFTVSVVHKLTSGFVDGHKHFDDFEACAKEFENEFKVYDKKQGTLWSPTQFVGDEVRRSGHTVLVVHALSLDIDGKPFADFEKVTALLDASGISYWWHTTFSHRGVLSDARLRLVIKLSRPVHAAEWRAFWPAAVEALEANDVVDAQCKDNTRMYFSPSAPSRDFYQFRYVRNAGGNIDVDLVLQTAPADALQEGFEYEEVPEELRAEITESYRAAVRGWVSTLCADIVACPHPGPGLMYEMKRKRVFSIAKRAPHCIAPNDIQTPVVEALRKRYEMHDAEELFQPAIEIVSKAIEDGMKQPWYLRLEDTQTFHPLTAHGLALRMFEAEGTSRLLWAQESQSWYYYDGARWKNGVEGANSFAVEVSDVIEAEEHTFRAEKWQARQTLERVEADPNVDATEKERAKEHFKRLDDMTDARYKFIKACHNMTFLPAALDFYKGFPDVQVDMDTFDNDPKLFNFRNGTLDLLALQLRAPSPDDRMTSISPYDYDEGATCPRFEQFLDEITLGDADMRKLLVQAAAYSMTASTSEQKFILLYGDGEDGKTTFLSTLSTALDGYSTRTNGNYFVETRGGGERHPTWLMRLHDKRFVWGEEPSHFRKLDEALVKDLTSGAPVAARRMRENETTFKVKFKIWLAANHLPKIDNVDKGIWRRIALVKFGGQFTTRTNIEKMFFEGHKTPDEMRCVHVRDPNLVKALAAEAQGILTLLAHQAQIYLQGEEIMWDTLDADVAAYKKESHPLRDFVMQECVSKKALKEGDYEVDDATLQHLLQSASSWNTPRKALYDAYLEWNKSLHTISAETFYKHLSVNFRFKKNAAGTRICEGLRLLTPQEKQLVRRGGGFESAGAN